jgi:hypothetical protein
VLNHLPVRYRVTVWVLGLVAFAGVGAWVALVTHMPLAWQAGLAVGVVLGGLAVVSFLRALADHEPRGPRQAV